MKAILYVGHGTRSKRGALEAKMFIESIMKKIPIQIQEMSFLELTSPSIDKGFHQCIARGATEIMIVPIFLLSAGHMKKDIPDVICRLKKKYPTVQVTIGNAFGVQTEILDALAQLIYSAVPDLSEEDALLIVGRGSSDRDIHQAFFKIEEGISKRLKIAEISTCYLAAAKPTFQEGLDGMLGKNKKRVIVIPYLLFSGLLLSEITHWCQKFTPKIVQVEPLSRHDAIKNIVIRSVLETEKVTALHA
ncbi:sirohydrochlorin chelatase [Robertmurraya sp. DFI.2.37]|jgi:sirohydrochlorin ferrochelatase|uniref:sirohydrochlorin chelatase n=1 Tax=Robertmurraya sp. DFI.2.37 TaxID=3031819 RepID=UPI001246EACB|nr:sirohydrochlorin chelatase [Robertmurraya sp. DFI.2.37]MDF1508536.1 sirohydrochlorin chelatase [Robertmurraya sp. DFI.2.37]